MKRLISFFVVSFCFLQHTTACTTFFINKNGQLVFGRNYDWITNAGMVCTNLKGLHKTSAKASDGQTTSWTSKYGSITFNQYGKEFPTGGMNEMGLVVELMWADGTQYPKADERASLGVLQWIQYQLDNHATIDEVIESDKKIRISQNNPPLHYLIADASGNAATIEYLNGSMVVHRGKDLPFPVLTNSTYVESAKAAREAKVLTGNTSFSFQDNSLQRFTKACSMVQYYQTHDMDKPITDYAFDILNDVGVKGFTKWSIVYDLKNKKVHFKTDQFPDIKSVAMSRFDFSCNSKAMVFDMNQSKKGEVEQAFQHDTGELNAKIIERSAEESKPQVAISEKDKQYHISYARSIHCKN